MFRQLRYLVRRILFASGLKASSLRLFYKVLFLLVLERERPFFIQIGANNGFSFDDFYEFAVAFDLGGIVVEPVKAYFSDLVVAYRYHPQIKPVNAALHPSEKTIVIYRVAAEAGSIPSQYGVASFFKEHLLGFGVPEADIVAEDVAAVTLNELYDQFGAGKKVDVLLVDTEGFDHEVLKMVDFSKINPTLIRFEYVNLPGSQFKEMQKLLELRGYAVTIEGMDAIAYKRDFYSNRRFVKAAMLAPYDKIIW